MVVSYTHIVKLPSLRTVFAKLWSLDWDVRAAKFTLTTSDYLKLRHDYWKVLSADKRLVHNFYSSEPSECNNNTAHIPSVFLNAFGSLRAPLNAEKSEDEEANEANPS